MPEIKQIAEETANTDPSTDGSLSKRRIVLLLGMIAVAIVLRLAFIGKSLWLDEGVAVANAWSGNSLFIWLHTLWRGEFNMVFYFALLRFWLKLGSSEPFIRLLSVIPAVLTLPFLYAIGSRTLNRRAGLIAALLLTFHGSHVLYSQEARSYTLAVLLCTVSTYLFLVAVENKSWKTWLLYVLCSSLAIYSHFFAGLILAAQWVSLAWAPRRSIPIRQITLSAIAIIIASGPALYFVFTNPGSQVNWIPRPSLGQVVNVFSEMSGSPLALPMYLVLWIVALRHGPAIYRRHGAAAEPADSGLSNWHWTLILAWAFVPILLALLLSLKRPMLVPRYLIVAVPGFLLLAAAGAMNLRPKWRMITLTLTVLLSTVFIGARYMRPKEDWRGAGHYVMTEARTGDAVVVLPWWAEAPFAYYEHRWPDGKPTELAASEISKEKSLGSIASRFRAVWVVIYARPQGIADTQTVEAQAALSRFYRLAGNRDFHLVKVEYYVRR